METRAHEGDDWALVSDDAEIVDAVTAEHSAPAVDNVADGIAEQRSGHDEAADAVPDGYLRVRLRIGENVRRAWFKATQRVDHFTKEFFADELANGKKIRLIYRGMLLLSDRSMGEYGVEEDGVIHAVINNAPPAAHPNAARNVELKGLSSPANALLVLTGVFLYGLWTLFYHFPHYFTWKSILLLSVFSAVHISASISRFTSS